MRRRGGSGRRLIALAVALAAMPAAAVLVGGGGSKRTDCLLLLDAPINYPPEKPRRVRCTDGDAACDADGTVDGVCSFAIGACANGTLDPRCTLSGVADVEVRYAEDNGDPKFDPDFQALQARIDGEIDPPTTDPDVCATPSIVRVPISGPLPGQTCRRAKKLIRITTRSLPTPTSPPRSDKDRLKLLCEPAPVGGCDPQVLFSGTFDRIQRQVFDASCATGGCHDSQSLAGGMTLESGTAHGSLVDVTPANPSAIAAGWKRVRTTGPGAGDPATSFLTHKLRGTLGPGFGEPMPLGRRTIEAGLIDIVDLWIAAGAPATGWVPGTD